MNKLFTPKNAKLALAFASITSVLFLNQSGYAAPGDKVHAYFADEHNTTPTSSTGNRILEIDIENMTLVNTLNVPGKIGHHADNGFNSKIYGVPKGSGFINSISLTKDQNSSTSMGAPKQIPLTHMPRSGDAFNAKFNVILMAAKNRPMGSFIDVETDEVVGTIGENVDCRLTDGTMLLSHADANTISGATKYQCSRASGSHGGDQISGHPYWLTSDYAAIVDRTNKQISVYHVQKVGTKLVSTLVNHLPTRSSIHQIVPRDRTNLPGSQQADFYAVEEGEHVGNMNPRTGRGNTDADYASGVAHSLLHLKLTTNGLVLVKRLNLQRPRPFSKAKSDRIIDACVANYRGQNRGGLSRTARYEQIFSAEGIARNPDQDAGADFPTECFFPGLPGGHNADFAPNNKHLYVGMAGGALSIIDVNRWKIVNNLDIGIRSGPGHTCFSPKHNLALTTNHGASYTRVIRNINTDRPTISQYLPLGFTRANLINTYQSHTCYIDEKEEFYYNFWTDGGVFYKMRLADIAANNTNGKTGMVTDSLVTGGIPIQGSYIYVKNIKDTSVTEFKVNNDTATSDGTAVTIDVLQNDTGVNIELEYADGANYGNVKIVNGKTVYTPITGFSGVDGFWYGVSSPGVEWKWAFVEVTVTSTTPPVILKAVNDTATVKPGNSISIDVLANDAGKNIKLSIVDTAWTGTATKSGNSITYQADPNYLGDLYFWYSITDAVGNEEWAKVTVTVENGTNALTAKNDTATVVKGQSVNINVLANDSGQNINLSIVDSAWTGTASKSGNQMRYQAPTDYVGDLEVWYAVTDSLGNEKWAKVTITITN